MTYMNDAPGAGMCYGTFTVQLSIFKEYAQSRMVKILWH